MEDKKQKQFHFCKTKLSQKKTKILSIVNCAKEIERNRLQTVAVPLTATVMI